LKLYFDPFFTQELDQGAIFRHGPVGSQQRHTSLAFLITVIAVFDQLFGFRQISSGQFFLSGQ
jgi:hypothetical protein